jgi:hypothetical protein
MPVFGFFALLIEDPEYDAAHGYEDADKGDDSQDLDDLGALFRGKFGHENNLPSLNGTG